MALASAIITSARYDLRDTDSTQYTDAELLDYLNRSLTQLYAVLGSLHSDWVHASDSSKTLSASSNSVTVPSDFATIRSLWIDDDELSKQDVDYIYYERKFITTAGQPDYYAIEGASIIFERTADQNYPLIIYYNKKATDLVSSGSMPFSDEFNQPIRQAIVLMAKNRNEYNVVGDSALYDFFMSACTAKAVMRRYAPKRYRIDF